MYTITDKILHFGLDHLEIYGTFKYEKELFDTLDFDNTNYSELEDYVITKLHTDHKFAYQITFSKDNYTLFNYIKGKPTANIPTKDYIIVYSTGFKILTDEEILYFLEGYFTLTKCRRFDICIDLKDDILNILAQFKEVKQKGSEFYDKNGDIATKYIGEKKNTKNKRSIIRIYNKLLDIIEKKKVNLYQDYLYEDNITRIELEIRQELAKNINYREAFDVKLLKRLFKNYLEKHTPIFNILEGEKISLYRKLPINIDPEHYQGMYYKTQKLNVLLGHARTVYKLGFCPVRVLIGEGYIQDKTKYILGIETIEDLHKKERNLRTAIKQRKINRKKLLNKKKYGY